jgi:hypothetical protein
MYGNDKIPSSYPGLGPSQEYPDGCGYCRYSPQIRYVVIQIMGSQVGGFSIIGHVICHNPNFRWSVYPFVLRNKISVYCQ